jgi:pseudaminic acid biosynthesis-associated methylase
VKTPQIDKWTGDFGRDYTDRNEMTLEQGDVLFQQNYGVTRAQLNADFLSQISRTARILEVGCNIGNQLLRLQQSGFKNLYGIEIQEYALQRARTRLAHAELRQASAFDIPYSSGCFDLVFTSGVLIHIAPKDLARAVAEIHRCTSSYIWGLEYYAPQPTEVIYRGSDDLLWKMNYAQFYRDQFPDLTLIREQRLKYNSNSNTDTMFLLQKTV